MGILAESMLTLLALKDPMVDNTEAELHGRLPLSGVYITLLARVWADKDGKSIRGQVKDVRTGAELPLDLSPLVAFVKASLECALDGEAETY
jgi:hypothetical protein